MTPKNRTALLALVLLTVLAVLVRLFYAENASLSRYARQVERFLHQREASAASFSEELAFTPSPTPSDALLRESWGLAHYNIAWYEGDSLVYSLNSRYLPEGKPGSAIHEEKGVIYLGAPHPPAIAWLPVWEEDYGFTGLPHIPNEVRTTATKGKYAVKNREGKPVLFLESRGPVRDPLGEGLFFTILLTLFGVLIYLLNGVATGLARRYSPWRGALFLILVAGVSLLAVSSGAMEGLGELPAFLQSPVQRQTLGGLLLNAILLLWFMIFFHREFQDVDFPPPPEWAVLALSTLNYLAITLGMMVVAQTVKNLALHSDLNIYLDNIFELNAGGLTGILVLMLLFLAFFLFSHRMISTIIALGLTPARRMGAFALSLLLAVPFYLWSDIPFSMVSFLLSVMVFVGMMDLLTDSPSPNLTWMIFLLVIISILAAMMLSSLRLKKDDQVQKELAIALSGARDPAAEADLEALTQSLQHSSDTGQVIEALFPDHPYLRHFYILDTTTAGQAFGQIDSTEGQPVYDLGKYGTLRKTREQSIPPLAVLTRPYPYKGLTHLDDFEYAVYRGGRLAEQSPKSLFPESGPTPAPGKAPYRQVQAGRRVEWVYHHLNGNQVVVRRQVGGLMEPISLASYMLALLIVFMSALGLLNHWFPFLPPSLEFLKTRGPTLSNRIQLSVVGFLLASFVLIGLISVWNFRKSADYNQEVQVKSKLDAIRVEAARQIREKEISAPGAPVFSILEELGRFHEAELLVYAPGGALAGVAYPVFEGEKWLSRRISDNTRYILTEGNAALVLQKSRIDGYAAQVAYLPFRGVTGEVVAITGLPFVNQASSWQKELSEFISSLISVYVSLLLLAGAVAIFIANSITQPISRLGESLRQLKLGKNEPLQYEGSDELAGLIQEYNRTLEKLEESTKKLAQSERESAWKEMARQVAHEIKNPLTPMKLKIQLLPMSLQAKPEKAKQLIDDVSREVLTQIEILSEIATAFSNFARMPEAQNSLFSLTELVSNASRLFSAERPDYEFVLSVPEESCMIFADKNQVNRVFNNLYKNAIQAIPHGQKGVITTRVSTEDGKVTAEVNDNGTGIPEEAQEKVFVPNFTTKSSGSGLGLAMSKSIIEAAKGRIWFETRADIGTSFFVELPLSS